MRTKKKIRKTSSGLSRKQRLESLRKLGLIKLYFIFVPEHVGLKGNERADKVSGMSLWKRDEQWTGLIFLILLKKMGI